MCVNIESNRVDDIAESMTTKVISPEAFDLKELLTDSKLFDPPLVFNEQTDDPNRLVVVRHLTNYLKDISARTVVIEQTYVDHDYLDDYTRYYARCFDDYPRKCRRIHFFSKAYARSDIEKMIAAPDPQDNNETDRKNVREFEASYLGFIVIRPLPTAIIGRTCLAVYEEQDCRYYKALMDVTVSFFGRTLKVRCMPFMQQDSAAAACATCALWSSFQVTSQFFGHKHYFPGCITELSMEHGLSESRCFPNKGLSIKDMVHAIRGVGLDPLCLDNTSGKVTKESVEEGIKKVSNKKDRKILQKVICGLKIEDCYETESFVRKLTTPEAKTLIDDLQSRLRDLSVWLGCIYAYLGAGLPVILTGVFDGSRCGHAVAVNGYRLWQAGKSGNAVSWLTSSRIEKIYAHDDGICPGAKMTLEDLNWKSEWTRREGQSGNRIFEARNLIVPAYHKIRMSFESVYERIESMILQFRGVRNLIEDSKPDKERLKRLFDSVYPGLLDVVYGKYPEWDIRLQKCGDFKAELRNEKVEILNRKKIDVLIENYPKYLWNICVSWNGSTIARFVIDATDCAQGLHVVDAFRYSEALDGVWKFLAVDAGKHGYGRMMEALGV